MFIPIGKITDTPFPSEGKNTVRIRYFGQDYRMERRKEDSKNSQEQPMKQRQGICWFRRDKSRLYGSFDPHATSRDRKLGVQGCITGLAPKASAGRLMRGLSEPGFTPPSALRAPRSEAGKNDDPRSEQGNGQGVAPESKIPTEASGTVPRGSYLTRQTGTVRRFCFFFRVCPSGI